jgi:hypothetical protein
MCRASSSSSSSNAEQNDRTAYCHERYLIPYITVYTKDQREEAIMKELSMLAAAVSLLLMPPGLEAASPGRIQIATPFKNTLPSRQRWIVVPRGGSDDSDQDNSDEYDSEEMEEDIIIEDDEVEYDDDTEEEEDIVMVKSAVKASEKAKAKKTAAVKETVNAKLSAKRAKKPSLVKRYVPYIVRASLSPLTLFAMTKAYFASLFNLDYLAEVSMMRFSRCHVCSCMEVLTICLTYLVTGLVTRLAISLGRKGEKVRVSWRTQG